MWAWYNFWAQMDKLWLSVLMVGVLAGGVLAVWRSLPGPKPLVNPVLGVSVMGVAENIWSPKEASASGGGPEVDARAAFFVETKTGKIMYQKNAHFRMPIASLTKIMTVIVAMEHRQLSDMMAVSEAAANMEPDRMTLKAGEQLSLEELLDGIFLVSGNDASEVLAEGVTGRREEFINLMNSKAASLGMNDTRFINPSGLEEEGKVQYSSAYDVALMSRYAISRWPYLVEISAQPHIFLPATATHQDYDLYSGISLLTTYPGVVGFKTGFTEPAGLTLVTLARRGNAEVLGVILNSDDRREMAKKLLDYSFEEWGFIE